MHTRLAIAAVLSLAAFGCSANVSATPDVADADANARTAAVIVVERTVGEGARGEATARFMRMRDPNTAEALRVVGATVDFPALGTCLSLASLGTMATQNAASAPATPSVQLVHVGSVSLEANGLATSLSARQIPDVVDLVSGVVYARATEPDLLPARARYVLHVSGAADAEPFSVAAHAPADLAEVRVATAPSSIDLAWEAGSLDDMVYVDIVSAADSKMPTVRCAYGDSGHATLAGALVPDEATLSIHRLHSEHFRARGIDSGEMRFDFAKVVAFSRH
jgi:hypothetical protein